MGFSDNEFTLSIARKTWRLAPRYFRNRLKNPTFVVGFNNSGKSTAVHLLENMSDLSVYPGEGNAELWFRGHFPWSESLVSVAPIWVAPEEFIRSSKDACGNSFERARAQLGAYQWLVGGDNLVNDSGMLAALAPDILSEFPDAKFVHFIRDGRLASYITARLEWSRIIRSPAKYIDYDCPLRFIEVLRKMAEYWVWTMQRMEKVSSLKPGAVLELRYEDWWSNPERMVNSVARFTGVSAPAEVDFMPRTDLTGHLLSEIPSGELSMLENVLGPTLREKGYLVDGSASDRF